MIYAALWILLWVISSLFLAKQHQSSTIIYGGGLIASIVLLTLMLIPISLLLKKDPPKKNTTPVDAQQTKPRYDKKAIHAKKLAATAKCRLSLQCWGNKKASIAAIYCDDAIERLAKYDFKWTDGAFGSKFSHFRWRDGHPGIITFVGDKIKLQNGFGAFAQHTYECDFDADNNSVQAVRIRQGRV